MTLRVMQGHVTSKFGILSSTYLHNISIITLTGENFEDLNKVCKLDPCDHKCVSASINLLPLFLIYGSIVEIIDRFSDGTLNIAET